MVKAYTDQKVSLTRWTRETASNSRMENYINIV